jgi:hypothetical protein
VELRRNLCSDAMGVVFVADLRPARHRATLEALDELRGHLESAGRSLDEIVLILQYNRRDLADENAIDALHRALDLQPSETFDAVASEGTGVLQTLTSLSKTILRRLRQPEPVAEPVVEPLPEPVLEPLPEAVLEPEPEAAPAAEARADLSAAVAIDAQPDEPGKTLEIESAGPVEGTGNEVRLPLQLIEPSSGRRFELCLKLTLEPV